MALGTSSRRVQSSSPCLPAYNPREYAAESFPIQNNPLVSRASSFSAEGNSYGRREQEQSSGSGSSFQSFDPKSDRYWESPPAAAVPGGVDLRGCNQMPFQELMPVPSGGSSSSGAIFSPPGHHHHQLLQFGDEQDASGGLASFGSINEAQAKQEMLAYQALCQAELMRSEKTPHRTQFQRENHILAERQRREEMNEKFTALKALLPKSTKKDKASIVGETISYVVELEKKLKELQSTARTSHRRSLVLIVCLLQIKPADVELQAVGGQAVIKIICQRTPGLALRILATLESCKVQVIQSNIATSGNHAILFFTVELNPSNTSNEELIASLELAAGRSD